MTREVTKDDAILVIEDGRYYAAIWFCDLIAPWERKAAGNFLASVWKPTDEKDFHLTYRFRWFRADKA